MARTEECHLPPRVRVGLHSLRPDATGSPGFIQRRTSRKGVQPMTQTRSHSDNPSSRRSFLKHSLTAGAAGASFLASNRAIFAQDENQGDGLTKGDAALLRFAAAA